jgi:hypothetical protein
MGILTIAEMVEECLFSKNKKVCLIDSKHKTYIRKNGRAVWYIYKDGSICNACYCRLIGKPKITPEIKKEYRKKDSPKRLQFRDRRIYFNDKPRTGYCSWCPNNIHDKSCQRTSMHHWIYIIILPWFGTEEICNSCHMKETWRSGQLRK